MWFRTGPDKPILFCLFPEPLYKNEGGFMWFRLARKTNPLFPPSPPFISCLQPSISLPLIYTSATPQTSKGQIAFLPVQHWFCNRGSILSG